MGLRWVRVVLLALGVGVGALAVAIWYSLKEEGEGE
ncbi:hypothetical protein IPA_02650 [Ignicoccus pacificus DSM 13166]|uniref:Uncharacterized protein n=1 Tax=Ignicoccus pacificus DSM 13166 TaxID=940294 RepID=A0A977PL79_9CREN|nr:hypothetical protein IPA_02650 [Ignicoccus pacificus DSM 13166]